MPPIREYICRSCGHEFEDIQFGSLDLDVSCPQCESKKLDKLVSSHGGYAMNSGPASVRPRQAGSFRTKKQSSNTGS